MERATYSNDARRMLRLGRDSVDSNPAWDEPWNLTINHNNAARVLLHDIYLKFHRMEYLQNRYLAGLVETLWHELRDGRVHPIALADSVEASAGSGHIQVFSEHRAEQRTFRALGLDGDPSSHGPNVQMVFHNNWSASKVDYYLRRTIHTSIRLTTSGNADVLTRVQLNNRADQAYTPLLLKSGIQRGLPRGMNRLSLHLLAPKGAAIHGLVSRGWPTSVRTGSDGGYPVGWTIESIPLGEKAVVTFSYHVQNFIGLDDRDPAFEFTLLPSPSVRPDNYSLEVVAPKGLCLEANDGCNRTLSLLGTLKRPVKVRAAVSQISSSRM